MTVGISPTLNGNTAWGAEGGGTSDVPPMPEEVGDLSDALARAREQQREKIFEQESPQRSPSLPEQNPDYRHDGSARASIGGISLNTTAWDFAPYLLDLKHRIKQHWIPPLAFTALVMLLTRLGLPLFMDIDMNTALLIGFVLSFSSTVFAM